MALDKKLGGLQFEFWGSGRDFFSFLWPIFCFALLAGVKLS